MKNLEADSTYMFLVRAVSSKAIGLPSVISDPVTTIGMYWVVNSRGQRSGVELFCEESES